MLHIKCYNTLHVTYCMLHIAGYISTHAFDVLVSNILPFVLFHECCDGVGPAGQVIPLHIASANNMADFGTTLVCLWTFVVGNHPSHWLVLRVYVMCNDVCQQRRHMSVPLYIMLIACTHVLIPNISLFIFVLWMLSQSHIKGSLFM